MTLDFLPPQAYTKETLLKAYNWLQSQSDQVKELATTPDQLVSLYLKSTRLGQESLQRYTHPVPQSPVQPNATVFSNNLPDQNERPSLQNFKSELKNLAGMMGDLEKPPTVTSPSSPYGNYQGPPSSNNSQASSNNYQSSTSSYVSSAAPISSTSPVYDENTQNLIREVKNELNLSTDSEALRMLVKIGYQKVRSLYK